MALSRLLIILLDNAMKYSSEQTQITLRVAKVKTHLVLEVRDEGCGISDDDKQKIFDRFFRVDKARSRSQGGLGLGLSLALAIVRQHQGSRQQAAGNYHVCEAADDCKVILKLSYKLKLR